MIKSLDPRVTRAQIEENNTITPLKDLDQWETYEVFHQKKRGDQHMHVGIVHAPNPEMALLFAKEQYGRRGMSVNIWVVGTRDVFTSDYDDTDMFDVSENTIMWANELGKNSVLKEGDMLVILPISGIRYTVKNGDTLKGIVLKYKSNLEEVLQYNDLTLSSTLVIGDTIVIPDAEPTNLFLPKIAQTRKIVTNKAHDTNGTYYPGFYIRPISGGVKSQNLHGYNAIDLAAPVGTVIRASASGKVISSISNGNWNGGYGNYVIISHSNGSQTLYAHNQKNFVRIGDYVEQGEMIAKIGMTGKTTGPHVHFEIRGAKNAF